MMDRVLVGVKTSLRPNEDALAWSAGVKGPRIGLEIWRENPIKQKAENWGGKIAKQYACQLEPVDQTTTKLH